MTEARPAASGSPRDGGIARTVGYAAILAVACFSLFASLDDRLLWGDEAETALLARNVLRFGIPRVDDGHNRVGHLGVRDANDAGVWIWSPWLDEYVTALAFGVGEPDAFHARVLFAATGLATILALGALAFRVSRSHEIAGSAMALLATCLPFLLHARQCRYYALVMFAMVWLIFGVQQLLERRRVGALAVAASLCVLFYSNYVNVPGPLVALGLVGLLLGRDRPELRRGVAVGVGIFALLALPWLVYAGVGAQTQTLGFARFLPNLLYYTVELHFHVVPWIALAVPLTLVALRKDGASLPNRELFVFVAVLVVAQLALLGLSPFRFFRYLTPLIAPLLLVTVLALHAGLRSAWLRRGVVALLCTSNLLAFVSLFPLAARHPIAAPHARFLRSLTRDYSDRLEDTVAFLKREARPEESLAVPDPEFPLAFHTGMAIIDTRRRGAWPPATPPDWVFGVSPSAIASRPPLSLPPELAAASVHESIEVRASKRGGGRPDPHYYEFFTAETRELIPVYRRRR